MDTSYSLERRSHPSKFEDNAAAGTIAKGDEPIRINPGLREKLIKRCAADSLHAPHIGQERHCPG
jgi:hypothetical protein